MKKLLLPLVWAALVGLSSISAYKSFTTEVLTSADLNSSFGTLVTGVNDLVDKFPGDSLTVGIVAGDTLAADGDAQITLADAIHSVNFGDSITVHRANIEHMQLDSLMFSGTAVTSTAAELNILDGVTSTAAELNILDGVTSTTAELNILDGVTADATELNLIDGVTSTTAELNILDGVTSTAAELNILDGVTATAAELNLTDGVTSTTAELNILDGVTASSAELNILDGVASTTAELNILDGVTATTAELNLTDGVTSTTAELNILDGVTSTAAELNILDGVTATAIELNLIDGYTGTTVELNLIDGYTGTTANLNTVTNTSNADALHSHAAAAATPSSQTSTLVDGDETSTNVGSGTFVRIYDLADPAVYRKGLAHFRAHEGNQSWVNELGPMPQVTMWVVSTAEDSLNIFDYYDLASGPWMTFLPAASNMVHCTSGSLTKVDFAEATAVVGCDGGASSLSVIDFLADTRIGWQNGNQLKYNGNIEQRNGTNGHTAVYVTAELESNIVYDASIIADPMGQCHDSFGRPCTWWAVASATITSVYNPYTKLIYDGTGTGRLWIDIAPTGEWAGAFSDGTRDYVDNGMSTGQGHIQSVLADASFISGLWQNNSSGGRKLIWGNAAIIDKGVVVPRMSPIRRQAAVVAGGDSGLVVLYANSPDPTALVEEGAQILIEDDFVSSYMKGSMIGMWPMHSVDDITAHAHNLTNHNTVTFNRGGPTGNYADFVAASSMALSHVDDADFGSTTSLTAGAWVWHDIAQTGDANAIINKWGSGAGSFTLYLAGNVIYANMNTDGSDGGVGGPTLAFAKWYHVVTSWDGAQMYLYVNGELVDTDSAATGTMHDSADILTIGSLSSGADPATAYFDGRLAGVFVTSDFMTPEEIQFDYQRGLETLEYISRTALNPWLTASNVNDINCLPTGECVTVEPDSITLWSPLMVPTKKIANSVGTTIKSAAILYNGGDSLSVAMVMNDAIETISPDPRIGGDRRHPPALTAEQSYEPCHVDSAGVYGLFWQGDDAVDACSSADIMPIIFEPGTYGPFDIDRDDVTVQGKYSPVHNYRSGAGTRGRGAVISSTTDDAIDVTAAADDVLIKWLTLDTRSTGQAYSAIEIAGGADNVHIIENASNHSDEYFAYVQNDYTVLKGNYSASSDQVNLLFMAGADYCVVEGHHEVSSGDGMINPQNGSDNCQLINNFSESSIFIDFAGGGGTSSNWLVSGNLHNGSISAGCSGCTTDANEQY